MDSELNHQEGKPTNESDFKKHSRRGFIFATASALVSCKSVTALSNENAGTLGGEVSVPKRAKVLSSEPRIQKPTYNRPALKNEIGSVPNQFAPSAGITFTRVLVSGNYVAMTFDDGPHPSNTPRLLDILAARNVKATFYVIGSNVDLYPSVLRRTVAEGHEIGNHTYTHPLLSKLGNQQVLSELRRCEDAVGRAAGVKMRTMRPPYGGLLVPQRQLVHSEFGYPTILWSVDPLDWKKPGASVITSRIVSGTSAGGILLAHDLHSQTVDAMPATLDSLLSRGFKFVTVSQLIAMQKTSSVAQNSATNS